MHNATAMLTWYIKHNHIAKQEWLPDGLGEGAASFRNYFSRTYFYPYRGTTRL